jgi:hypothetical protein
MGNGWMNVPDNWKYWSQNLLLFMRGECFRLLGAGT